jgi:hypothetical protein
MLRVAVQRVAYFLAVTTFSGAGILVSAAPASAHDTSAPLFIGRPPIGIARGGVDMNHTRIWAQDLMADGRGVRTWYWTDRGGVDYVGDPNGSSGGRGQERAYDGGRVTAFQVCAGPLSNEICGYIYNA